MFVLSLAVYWPGQHNQLGHNVNMIKEKGPKVLFIISYLLQNIHCTFAICGWIESG